MTQDKPALDPKPQQPAKARATEVVLAFDFGLKHIGVACGQSVTATANPVATLSARNGKPRNSEITELIAQWGPNRLVVGLPLNMDDSESDMTSAARQFAARLHQHSGLPTTLVDERLTSKAANEQFGADPKNNHALAAVVIAQSYLQDPTSVVEQIRG